MVSKKKRTVPIKSYTFQKKKKILIIKDVYRRVKIINKIYAFFNVNKFNL